MGGNNKYRFMLYGITGWIITVRALSKATNNCMTYTLIICAVRGDQYFSDRSVNQ